MTVSYWQDARAQKTAGKVDVAIIGGGIMGAASAYWLSKRKGLKVAVFEAQKRAWGASGRGAGFAVRTLFAYYNQAIAAYGRDAAKWLLHFNEESLQLISQFVEVHGNKCSYEQCGSYLLACSQEELRELEESAQLMRDDGFDAEFCPTDPLCRGYLGGLYNRCDIGINTSQLVNMLFEISGAAVYEQEPVWRIEGASDGSIKVISIGHEVVCSRLLLTTNAYSALLEPWFHDKIQPVRGQILVTKPLASRIIDAMCSANYGWDYFRQLPDNRFLLGGRRFMQRAEEVGFTDMVTEPIQTALHSYLTEYFPEVAQLPVDYRWSGVMAFTRDELPMIGELIQQPVVADADKIGTLPGAFYAVGCNGHGLAHSFALAKLLVEVALDGASAKAFAAERLTKRTSQPTWSHAQQPGS